MNNPVPQVKPEVIFFDAAGTLIHLVRPAGHHYAEVARSLGLPVDPTAMEAAFRQAWKAQPPRETTPGPRLDDDRPWWKTLALSALHTAAPVPADFPAGQWFDQVYARFAQPGVWALYDDVLPCLDYWQPRARLAILSNFDRRLHPILHDLGILSFFESILLSSELGADKPAPEIFHRACTLMHVAPAQSLHIGDDPRLDWTGATAAGLLSYPLDRPKNSLNDLRP